MPVTGVLVVPINRALMLHLPHVPVVAHFVARGAWAEEDGTLAATVRQELRHIRLRTEDDAALALGQLMGKPLVLIFLRHLG